MPGFLSPAAYAETWTEYQATLCNYLNDETAGTTLENIPVKKLHIDTSKQPSKAALYNHAAQAHHNHFFFNGLSSVPEPYTPSYIIESTVKEYFESLEHLRDEMTDAALSMFGNGYVWLLAEELADSYSATSNVGGPLRILCTYNAGSPFADAHARRQGVDGNTGIAHRLTAGAMGDFSSNRITSQPRAFNGQPILCLKVWEHQWMRDYGLAGKQTYVHNWWNRVDWDEVHARLNVVGAASSQNRHGMGPAARSLYQRAVNVSGQIPDQNS